MSHKQGHDAHTYDVVVIGAGLTGENVADRAVKGGLSAVVVEADLIGGDCSYRACMGYEIHEHEYDDFVTTPRSSPRACASRSPCHWRSTASSGK